MVLVDALPEPEPEGDETHEQNVSSQVLFLPCRRFVVVKVVSSVEINDEADVFESDSKAGNDVSEEEVPESDSAERRNEYVVNCQRKLVPCSSVAAPQERLETVHEEKQDCDEHEPRSFLVEELVDLNLDDVEAEAD